MLIPIFIPSLSCPVNEKKFVLTKTPKSTAKALAELCQILELIYLMDEPNENQDTIFQEKVSAAATSDAPNLSPVPS